jgi:hypothetical protein
MVQVNPLQQSVMAYGIVPVAVNHNLQDQPFAVVVLTVKAVFQTADSATLPQPAPIRRIGRG